MTATLEPSLRLGISSCLMGEEVRWNGGHKRDGFLLGLLNAYVEWFPLCPEVEIGLGTPRETIHLIGAVDQPRLVGTKSGADHTETMQRWARESLEEIAGWDLHGFVLKRASPSCGLFRVKVRNDKGMPEHTGRGIFARELAERFPLLPLEEEGRLHDLGLRENFIERVFVYERWQRLLRENPTPAGLVDFHTRHKLAVMAHSPKRYRELGRMVADAGKAPWRELAEAYASELFAALAVKATRGRHRNVLHHLMGFVKNELEADDKVELLEAIDDYAAGLMPLVVPLTLLNHHFRRLDAPDWVSQQVYLHPYPKELMLRSHA